MFISMVPYLMYYSLQLPISYLKAVTPLCMATTLLPVITWLVCVTKVVLPDGQETYVTRVRLKSVEGHLYELCILFLNNHTLPFLRLNRRYQNYLLMKMLISITALENMLHCKLGMNDKLLEIKGINQSYHFCYFVRLC